jgi:hypothetical protein
MFKFIFWIEKILLAIAKLMCYSTFLKKIVWKTVKILRSLRRIICFVNSIIHFHASLILS